MNDTPPPKHHWYYQPRTLVGLLSTAALLYVIAPTGLQINAEQRKANDKHVVTQSKIPLARVAAADQALLPAVLDAWDNKIEGRPFIISYHDISLTPTSKYTVTPTAFAEQMAVLDAMGAYTLSATEFRTFTEGGKIPPRSVLITHRAAGASHRISVTWVWKQVSWYKL